MPIVGSRGSNFPEPPSSRPEPATEQDSPAMPPAAQRSIDGRLAALQQGVSGNLRPSCANTVGPQGAHSSIRVFDNAESTLSTWAPWDAQNPEAYVSRNYAVMHRMDEEGLPFLRDAINRKLPLGIDRSTLTGADLGSGPSPNGVLVLTSVGLQDVEACEYAASHRIYLEDVFSTGAPIGDHQIWGKFAHVLGVDSIILNCVVGQLDLRDRNQARRKVDVATCLTVVESCTDNPVDFHTALLNAVDIIKDGGVGAFSFMGKSRKWTDDGQKEYPAADISDAQIRETINVFDRNAKYRFIPAESSVGYEHSKHEGMTLVVFNKPLGYDRSTIARQITELRATWPQERHYVPRW